MKIAHRMFVAVLCVFAISPVSVIPGDILAEDKGISRFFLDYAVVDHSLKNDQGYSMELTELFDIDPSSASFIAEFWHKKAFIKYEDQIKSIIHRYVSKAPQNVTEDAKSNYFHKMDEEISQIFYGFYYDNWDAINETIMNRLKAADIKIRRK